MSGRVDLELTIIGNCLEGSFGLVKNILNHKNFTQTDWHPHQKIWLTMEKLFLKHPIDVVTVSQLYQENYNRNIRSHLMCSTQHLVNNCPTKYALRLFEIDVKQKLSKEVQLVRANLISQGDLNQAALYDSVLSALLNDELDFFNTIEGIEKYLKYMNGDTLDRNIEKIFNSIPERIKRMQMKSGLDLIFHHLNRYVQSHFGSTQRESIQTLVTQLNAICYEN
jgi:hypothetical protein